MEIFIGLEFNKNKINNLIINYLKKSYENNKFKINIEQFLSNQNTLRQIISGNYSYFYNTLLIINDNCINFFNYLKQSWNTYYKISFLNYHKNINKIYNKFIKIYYFNDIKLFRKILIKYHQSYNINNIILLIKKKKNNLLNIDLLPSNTLNNDKIKLIPYTKQLIPYTKQTKLKSLNNVKEELVKRKEELDNPKEKLEKLIKELEIDILQIINDNNESLQFINILNITDGTYDYLRKIEEMQVLLQNKIKDNNPIILKNNLILYYNNIILEILKFLPDNKLLKHYRINYMEFSEKKIVSLPFYFYEIIITTTKIERTLDESDLTAVLRIKQQFIKLIQMYGHFFKNNILNYININIILSNIEQLITKNLFSYTLILYILNKLKELLNMNIYFSTYYKKMFIGDEYDIEQQIENTPNVEIISSVDPINMYITNINEIIIIITLIIILNNLKTNEIINKYQGLNNIKNLFLLPEIQEKVIKDFLELFNKYYVNYLNYLDYQKDKITKPLHDGEAIQNDNKEYKVNKEIDDNADYEEKDNDIIEFNKILDNDNDNTDIKIIIKNLIIAKLIKDNQTLQEKLETINKMYDLFVEIYLYFINIFKLNLSDLLNYADPKKYNELQLNLEKLPGPSNNFKKPKEMIIAHKDMTEEDKKARKERKKKISLKVIFDKATEEKQIAKEEEEKRKAKEKEEKSIKERATTRAISFTNMSEERKYEKYKHKYFKIKNILKL